MTKPKHTKGTWSVDSGDAIYIRAEHGGYICIIGHMIGKFGRGGRVPSEEAIANAKLIAAAPRMRQMLAEIQAGSKEEWIKDCIYGLLKEI